MYNFTTQSYNIVDLIFVWSFIGVLQFLGDSMSLLNQNVI